MTGELSHCVVRGGGEHQASGFVTVKRQERRWQMT